MKNFLYRLGIFSVFGLMAISCRPPDADYVSDVDEREIAGKTSALDSPPAVVKPCDPAIGCFDPNLYCDAGTMTCATRKMLGELCVALATGGDNCSYGLRCVEKKSGSWVCKPI